jgi:hypothetical protein
VVAAEFQDYSKSTFYFLTVLIIFTCQLDVEVKKKCSPVVIIKNLFVELPSSAILVQSTGKSIGIGIRDVIVRKYRYRQYF